MKRMSCVVLYNRQMTICFFIDISEKMYQIFENRVPSLFQGCSMGNENSLLVLDLVTLCCECSLGLGSYK